MDWKKIRSVIWHIIFWVCLFLLYLYINNPGFFLKMAILQSLILLVIIVPLTYFNIAYLVPRFFEQKNKGVYVVFLAGVIFLGATLMTAFEETNLFRTYRSEMIQELRNEIFPEGLKPDGQGFMPYDGLKLRLIPGDSLRPDRVIPPPRDSLGPGRMAPPFGEFRDRPFRSLFPFQFRRWSIQLFQTAFIILLSTVYSVSQMMTKKQKEALALESEKLSSELRFLKSQINPHFLFNALNNIYTLSMIKSEKTPDVVMRLSDMLKYIIYETETRDQVPLQKEIAYIENYIAIFKLKDSRIDENVTFNYDVPDDLYIAPMLLIPFIENAFKHSKIEDVKSSWIKIDLNHKGFELIFSVKNFMPSSHFEKDKLGGIGIANVKRRLELIYYDRHLLTIQDDGNVHSVLMKIIIGE